MKTTQNRNGGDVKKKADAKKVKPPKVKTLPTHGYIYQVEYHPNPDCMTFHSRTKFPKGGNSGLGLKWDVKHEKDKEMKGEKLHQFYKDLSKIRGLHEASPTHEFGLHCMKVSHLFSWDEIIPKMLEVIKRHIARKRKMVEAGPAIHPSGAELIALNRERMMGFY